jgi:hypothetical protein
MRPRDRLKASLSLTVMAVLVGGGCAANRFPELVPVHTITTRRSLPRTPSVMLPEGAQRTTDPNPHPTGTYRTPEWAPETKALAGLVTTATVQIVVAMSTIRVFGR